MLNAIKSLIREVASFIRKDFHWASYLYTAGFVVGSICLNYQTNDYAKYIGSSFVRGNSIEVHALFYAVIYYAVAVPILFMRGEYRLLKTPLFYLKSGLFLVLYSIGVGYVGHFGLKFQSISPEERQFLLSIINQLKGIAVLFPVLWILKKMWDRNIEGFYGLSRNKSLISAYLGLYALMFPFLILVSFTPDFLEAYPQFKFQNYHGIFSLPVWVYTLVYEWVYALDFISTELLFRGALVIGMASIMGRKSVLPMVAVYVAIHFEKPVIESISSLFGGYLLGALAYQTKHIWGGVTIHILIALSMEIMGFTHLSRG